jgi:hypothetical protein
VIKIKVLVRILGSKKELHDILRLVIPGKLTMCWAYNTYLEGKPPEKAHLEADSRITLR